MMMYRRAEYGYDRTSDRLHRKRTAQAGMMLVVFCLIGCGEEPLDEQIIGSWESEVVEVEGSDPFTEINTFHEDHEREAFRFYEGSSVPAVWQRDWYRIEDGNLFVLSYPQQPLEYADSLGPIRIDDGVLERRLPDGSWRRYTRHETLSRRENDKWADDLKPWPPEAGDTQDADE